MFKPNENGIPKSSKTRASSDQNVRHVSILCSCFLSVYRLVFLLLAACAVAVFVPSQRVKRCDQAHTHTDAALLRSTVDFTTEIFGVKYLSSVPGVVMGITKNGQRHVSGFGTTRTNTSVTPNAKTLMRVGSLTKVFTGNTLASVLVSHEIQLSDSAATRLNWTGLRLPNYDGKEFTIFNLATHSSGLDREMVRPPSPPYVRFHAFLCVC